MNNYAVMVDLETMDVTATAAVLSIGACFFNPVDENTKDELIASGFERTISLETNLQANRTISASTIMWWMQQSDEARKRLYAGDIVPLRKALTDFEIWLSALNPKPTRFWAKDPDFDAAILANCFGTLNKTWPFPYWSTRSVRTITEMAYPDPADRPPRSAISHTALDDAVEQALLVQRATALIQS